MRKTVKLKLSVNYTDDYPNLLPELELEAVEGEIDEPEHNSLLQGLADVVSMMFVGFDRCVQGAI